MLRGFLRHAWRGFLRHAWHKTSSVFLCVVVTSHEPAKACRRATGGYARRLNGVCLDRPYRPLQLAPLSPNIFCAETYAGSSFEKYLKLVSDQHILVAASFYRTHAVCTKQRQHNSSHDRGEGNRTLRASSSGSRWSDFQQQPTVSL